LQGIERDDAVGANERLKLVSAAFEQNAAAKSCDAAAAWTGRHAIPLRAVLIDFLDVRIFDFAHTVKSTDHNSNSRLENKRFWLRRIALFK